MWRLEVVSVLSGQAAVGEDALPNLHRPNFRKGWQNVDCNAGGCGGRMGRRAFRGGHGKGGEDGEGRIQAGRVKKAGEIVHAAASCIPGLDQLMTATIYDCHRSSDPTGGQCEDEEY